MNKLSYVIVVSGPSGSGKTTIVKALKEYLGDSESLYFDDYASTHRFPEDGVTWLNNGADPKMVVNKEFYHDLEQLVMGNPIIPNKDKLTNPTKFVIVEEPFGRGRLGMDKLVDFVICLDTPLEISLARRLLEWTEPDIVNSKQTLLKINGYLTQYLMGVKDLYRILNEGVKLNCDLVINGIDPVEDMIKTIITELKKRTILS